MITSEAVHPGIRVDEDQTRDGQQNTPCCSQRIGEFAEFFLQHGNFSYQQSGPQRPEGEEVAADFVGPGMDPHKRTDDGEEGQEFEQFALAPVTVESKEEEDKESSLATLFHLLESPPRFWTFTRSTSDHGDQESNVDDEFDLLAFALAQGLMDPFLQILLFRGILLFSLTLWAS